MMDKLLQLLTRWLHPRQAEIDPGRFEAFLTPVPRAERIESVHRRIEARKRAA